MPLISEYLGRGDGGDEAPVTQALRGQGTKTARSRGGKRAGTANVASTRKRRKTSDVSEGMTVTKPAAKKAKSKVIVENEAETDAPANPQQHADDDAAEHVASNVNQAVPVFAPPTSMQTYHSAGQQTSVQALKSAHGRTKTLYRRTETPGQDQPDISYAEPWLNIQPTSEAQGTSPLSARVLRPRHEKAVAVVVPGQDQEARMPAAKSKTGKQKNKAAPQQKAAVTTKSGRRRRSTRSYGEDFFGDDDDIDEVMALADTVEKVMPSHRPTKKAGKTPLATPVTSDAPAGQPKATKRRTVEREPTQILTADEEFIVLDDEQEAECEGTPTTSEADHDSALRRSPTPPPRDKKFNMREVDEHEDYGGALLSDSEIQLLEKLKSTTPQYGHRPMVRLPFPATMLDRSPIFGATNTTTLRTCFRIGEALKEGCQAVRCNRNVIVELFARVTASWREPHPSRKQHFAFKDLYHDKPPHLEGTYELWGQSRLWDMDSQAFLQTGKEGKGGAKMCRVVARIRRVEMAWRLEVLSIWEADWEDVEVAGKIFAKVYGFPRD